VDVKSWIVCWCVCIGIGIGGKDGPALFDLGVAACYGHTLVFWCRSGVSGFQIMNCVLVCLYMSLAEASSSTRSNPVAAYGLLSVRVRTVITCPPQHAQRTNSDLKLPWVMQDREAHMAQKPLPWLS